MAISDENMVMPVSPMNNGGFGGFGDGNGWWIILLFLVFGMGGFGGYGNNGGAGLYPWLNQSNQVNDGFREQMLNTSINGIASGVQNLATQMCNGFATAEVSDNARQIADMQQGFAMQTAITSGQRDIQSQLAQCCCDNRLATANLGSDIAREACATRTNDTQNTQAILNAVNDGIRSIHDQMCNDKIDAKNEKITELQNRLTMAELRANNNLQTQTLLADNLAQTGALERYLAPTPIPAYVVQNPNCCTQNYGCGCGV